MVNLSAMLNQLTEAIRIQMQSKKLSSSSDVLDGLNQALPWRTLLNN